MPAPSRHRSRLLSPTVRRLAQAPPTPFRDGQKSVASRAHTNMRATTDGAEIPRSGKCLPRRAIALGCSPRPCAGSRKHRRPRFALVENRSRRAPTPICMQRPTGPKSRGPVNACPVAPSLSATLPDRAPARASTPTPFIDGRKSVASRAHANMRATTDGAEIPRSGKCLPRRAIALGCSPRPCAGSRKHRRPRFAMVKNRSRRAPTPICVQRPTGPKSRGRVNACPVAPSLSAALPDRAPARASTADPVSRWSKIGRVARPRQYACNDRRGRNPEVL
jgi:hypothetical protein